MTRSPARHIAAAMDAGIDYVSRAEAVRRLGVKPATLYTYVSRGWIRRVVAPGGRRSLYHAEDIETLKARSGARAAEGIVAAAAMRYGEPIVPTSITEITPEGPSYRNRSAVELARQGWPFEAAAELLWTGTLREDRRPWRIEPPPTRFLARARELPARDAPLDIHDAMALCTLFAGIDKGRPAERTGGAATQWLDAMQLIHLLCGCFGLLARPPRYREPVPGEAVASSLAASLALRPATYVTHLLDAALTLSADHELNPATFVARIAASSDVDVYSCVAAAICTDSGARIARACDRLEEQLVAVGRAKPIAPGGAADDPAAGARLGFSHPLYPRGDPRGALLIAMTREVVPATAALRRIYAFLDESAQRHRLYPRIEMALALLAVALGMPARSAAGIYTLGRVAGWLAHMFEQRLAGFLIRPRARYVG